MRSSRDQARAAKRTADKSRAKWKERDAAQDKDFADRDAKFAAEQAAKNAQPAKPSAPWRPTPLPKPSKSRLPKPPPGLM